MMYKCLCCYQPVKAVHIPGRYMSPTWVHLDGYEECRPTYASPNFDQPVLEKEKVQ